MYKFGQAAALQKLGLSMSPHLKGILKATGAGGLVGAGTGALVGGEENRGTGALVGGALGGVAGGGIKALKNVASRDKHMYENYTRSANKHRAPYTPEAVKQRIADMADLDQKAKNITARVRADWGMPLDEYTRLGDERLDLLRKKVHLQTIGEAPTELTENLINMSQRNADKAAGRLSSIF